MTPTESAPNPPEELAAVPLILDRRGDPERGDPERGDPERQERRTDWLVGLGAWIVSRGVALLALEGANWGWQHTDDKAKPLQLAQGLLAWDGAFYADIAARGYAGVDRDALRFFPVLPGLGRSLGFLPGIDARSGVVMVAMIAALAFAVMLRRLIRLESGDPALATRAVWIAMLLPNAFVLSMGYSEALFLALSVAVFLALRSQRFAVAGGMAALTGATRPVGVLLAIPIAVIAWPQVRAAMGAEQRRAMVRFGAVAAAPPVAAVAFLSWIAATQDVGWREPLNLQNAPNLRGGTEIPGPNLWHALSLLRGDRVGYGFHAITAAVLLALVVVLVRRGPIAYAAYTGATVLVALTAHNLESFERYALGAFPLALALAVVLGRREVLLTAVACSAAAGVVLGAMTFGGDYVP